ncbi:hypothetical protein Ahy_B02g058809 isoform A [Arachis hypogaea]|uniref:CCHC-type domain-containing protein n=1 Tax=Arachis hypogaea TaxID=3818 RepID=A0A445AFI4_ARAHY|nr:hypothetical protein Ahy_B02g058809 isoform A [Arachis hypogaea]
MLCIYQQTQFYVPMIELYVEFEQQSELGPVGEEVNIDEVRDIDWEEDNNNDSEEEFEANYEVDDENDDGDLAGNPAVQNEANAIVSQHPFGVSSFMRTLDLETMHAPEFPEYANTGEGNTEAEDGEFRVGMEFGSRESVISAIKSYTVSRGVDYTMYEFEPQTFYAKCKGYGYSRTEQEYNKNYQRLKERGNIVVNRFDRRNEMFEVREMQDGRPKSTRYLNEMDSRDMRGPRRCTLCGHEGHSRSRCPQRAGPSSPGESSKYVTIHVPVAHEARLPGEGQLVLPVAAVVHRRQPLRLELYLTVAVMILCSCQPLAMITTKV